MKKQTAKKILKSVGKDFNKVAEDNRQHLWRDDDISDDFYSYYKEHGEEISDYIQSLCSKDDKCPYPNEIAYHIMLLIHELMLVKDRYKMECVSLRKRIQIDDRKIEKSHRKGISKESIYATLPKLDDTTLIDLATKINAEIIKRKNNKCK